MTSIANAEASSSRRRLNAIEDHEDRAVSSDDEKVGEDGWTIETFKDRPIVKDNATQSLLRGLIDHLKIIKLKVNEGMEKAKEAAKAIEDASPDDPLVEKLEKDFWRGIEQRAIIDIRIGVLEGFDLELRQNKALTNPAKLYEEESRSLEKKYMAKTPRQKFNKDEDYISFRQEIWEINHPDDACPPVSRWLPRAEGDESDDEDDFELGGQTQNYRCPMTLRPYVEAVTSSLCNHSYSKEAIYGLIDQAQKGRRGKKEVRCPVTGCQAKISKEDLKSNPDLQRRTDEYEKRKQRREEEEYESDD